MFFDSEAILNMEKRYRAKFINCLSGPKSANLIGTVDANNKTNLSIVSSCVHLGANPALMAMIIRPRAVPRHTLDNLMETKHWTVNHVTSSIIKQAHQTSARYEKDISEFEAVGLTPEYLNDFPAPYVKECSVKIGLKLVEVVLIKHNDTEMVIGEIQHVHAPKESLLDDGPIHLGKTDSVSVTGLDQYHSLSTHYRLSYAKPEKEVEEA